MGEFFVQPSAGSATEGAGEQDVPIRKFDLPTLTRGVKMEDTKQNIPSFIGKLSSMLQDPSSSPYVSWSSSGESIIVNDPSAFATAVLPRCDRLGPPTLAFI